MKPIPTEDLSCASKELLTPSLHLVASVLQDGLRHHYREVSVRVVQCPNLTRSPFNLASQGICGRPRLVESGGVPNLVPLAKKEKLYDLRSVARLVGDGDEANQLLIGAGAAPWTHRQRNGELIPNLLTTSGGSRVVYQGTRAGYTDGKSIDAERFPEDETKFSLLSNIFVSDGECGKPVLEIKCSKRRENGLNLVSAMRRVLAEAFPSHVVGAGGTFLVKRGKIKIHVMPEFSSCPLESDEDVNSWLKFFDVDAPFVCMSTFVTRDPGLDLRLEHTHGFSDLGTAGHYHCDVTPDDVEYVGYYNVAEAIYRIDPPAVTHMIGRD